MRTLVPLATRFWAKVNRNGPTPVHRPELGPCWEWTAYADQHGYGQIGLSDGTRKHAKAHRVSWILSHGAIPLGLCVLHQCDNPPCVNSAHLFLGTKKDNTRDMVSKGRARGGGPRGERQHAAKLTADGVREIRRLKEGGMVQARIAEQFGLSQSSLSAVIVGKTWRHVK